MTRKLKIWVWLVCIFMLLSYRSAYGKNVDEVTQEAGDSQVLAGILVEYTGKLNFLVLERDTNKPIAGVSVELYIPGEDRYVLFGVTDKDGRLKVDVVPGNEVKYRVYKSDWKPYPEEGTAKLQQSGTEQTVTVYLYRKKSGGGSGGSGTGGSSSGGSTVTGSPVITAGQEPGQPEEFQEIEKATGSNTTGIPKTGVEGAAGYWITALICFLSAGLFLAYLIKLEKDAEDKKYGR